MTPRDVLDRLTPEQRFEIASICLETMDLDAVWGLIRTHMTELDLYKIGLRIKLKVTT